MNKDNKTIYLHIGMPKTGSSTLQHFMNKNSAILEKEGLFYPKDKYPCNLRSAILEGYNKSLDEYNLYIKNNFIEKLEKTDCKKIVLSDEMVWTLCRADVCDIFLNHGYDLKVIAYLRKPVEYLASSWQENIKAITLSLGAICPLDEFLKIDIRYSIIEDFIKNLGKDNVIVRPFEKEQWINGNLIDDFLYSIEISTKIDTKNFPFQNDHQVNRNYCEFMRLIKAFGLNQDEFIEVIKQYLRNYTSEEEINSLPKNPKNIPFFYKLLNNFIPSEPKIISTLTYEQVTELLSKWEPTLNKIAKIYGKEKMFTDIMPKGCSKENNKGYKEIVFTPEQIEIIRSLITNQKKVITSENQAKKQSIVQKLFRHKS